MRQTSPGPPGPSVQQLLIQPSSTGETGAIDAVVVPGSTWRNSGSAALRISRKYLWRIRMFLPLGGAARSVPPSKGPTFSTRLNRRQTGEGEVWADLTVPFVASLKGKVLECLLLFFHFWLDRDTGRVSVSIRYAQKTKQRNKNNGLK